MCRRRLCVPFGPFSAVLAAGSGITAAAIVAVAIAITAAPAAAVIAAVAAVVVAAEIPAATAAQKDENDDDDPRATVVTHFGTPPFVYIPYYSMAGKVLQPAAPFLQIEISEGKERKSEYEEEYQGKLA